MKVLIVDDETLALSRLKRLLKEAGITDITACDNGLEAMKEIGKNSFDLAFLDISMPQISGLELANHILEVSAKTFIVFQTAYTEYALEAFQNGGVGYLMKPVPLEEIEKVLEKVRTLSVTTTDIEKKIMGKSGSRLYIISRDDIYYIKADLDEVIIKIKEADVYVRKKIGDLEILLDTANFFRVHRSYIVNIDKIKSMKSVEQSKLEISFKDISSVVTSSKDGAKVFREYLEKVSL
ncbi:MAG: Two-component system response regulator, LytR/AlgR family [uncultured Sulfurovum sp.]|uniref:Two-component system response regulator, LytR/AlgR family n=1 Tax=uncultured Sulfurovum sp. TaxID=269237 RepID=A0A6S6T1J6_9BACT|nr:MAG: Two-component system response regulator, LytR/AlgR family [uncultured Sulfurovum sp.]